MTRSALYPQENAENVFNRQDGTSLALQNTYICTYVHKAMSIDPFTLAGSNLLRSLQDVYNGAEIKAIDYIHYYVSL